MPRKYIYKLTAQDMTTYGGFQWKLGEWPAMLSGKGDLCGPGYYHAYEHPLLAVLHNPIHADIYNPRLYRCEYQGPLKRDCSLKCGVQCMRLMRQLRLPVVTTKTRVRYAILCSLAVYSDDEHYVAWARGWLSGQDRAADAAWAAARSAAWAAARSATWDKPIDLVALARKAVRDEAALQRRLAAAKEP